MKAQRDFLLQLDRLKSMLRQSSLANASRRENSAEHSGHLATFAHQAPARS
jgi:putative hydrolase of HD superfamily